MKKIQTITYAFLCAGAITLVMSFAGGRTTNASSSSAVSSAKVLHAATAEDETNPQCSVPATPAAINGSPVVCADLPGNYSIAPVAGATTYVWTVVGGHVTSSNASKTAVTIKWGLSAKSVSVKAVNNCGSSGTRTLTITRVIPKCL